MNKTQKTEKDDSSEDTTNIVRIRGRLMWPKLFVPDPGPANKNWKPKWGTDLLLDAHGLEKAKSLNLKVQKERYNKKEKIVETPYVGLYEGFDGSFLKLSRYVTNKRNEEVDPPAVKYADNKTDVPRSVMIGNGTDAVVRMLIMDQTPDEDTGEFGVYLLGVSIANLVKPDIQEDGEEDFAVIEDASFFPGEDLTESDEDDNIDNPPFEEDDLPEEWAEK